MQNLLWPCCLECYSCFNCVLVTLRKHFWLLKPKSKFCAILPKAGWRWKSLFGKTSNLNSEARNRFQYTKIEREVKNNNVYHYPGLEFQYNQLSLWTKVSKYAKIQLFIFSTGYLPFRPGLVSGDRGSENWLKNGSKTVAKRIAIFH